MTDLFDYAPPKTRFPIETGIPISTDRSDKQRTQWNAADFPFGLLMVGQSFAVQVPAEEEVIYTQNKVSGAASTFAKNFARQWPGSPPRLFTTRQQAGNIVRCWRVA